MTVILAGLGILLLTVSGSVDTRTRFPSLLIDKLKARSSQTGCSVAQLIRYYTLLGMRCEDALPSILPMIGNLSSTKPATSRRQCQRYYMDSDLIDAVKQTPEGILSASQFVNIAVRNELIKRKNKTEEV